MDDLVKNKNDNPSVGLVLCKTKNNVLAEYTLRDLNKPMGLSEYMLRDALPKDVQTSLPSIEKLETELSKEIEETLMDHVTEVAKDPLSFPKESKKK